MSRPCRTEAARLLDFYVNGTLRGAEHAGVAEHIAGCADCAREFTEIEAVQRLLPEAPGGILRRPERRSLRVVAAIAAAVIAAVLGIWIATSPGKPPATVTARVGILDLGAGAARGGPRPAVSIAADVASVEVRFGLTVEPGASYFLRLHDPRGVRVFGPVPVAPWDPLGSSLQRFHREVFAIDGEYRLEVEESPPDSPPRLYDYAFSVRVAK